MRRKLRRVLPALSAVYGLKWDDVYDMPGDELEQYLDQLPAWRGR